MEIYEDIFIYVPSKNNIIEIMEGCGDNLLPEDIVNGYVDYIYYEQYAVESGMPHIDGGQVMLTTLFREKYEKTEDCVPDVLDMAYGSAEIEYQLLQSSAKKGDTGTLSFTDTLPEKEADWPVFEVRLLYDGKYLVLSFKAMCEVDARVRIFSYIDPAKEHEILSINRKEV